MLSNFFGWLPLLLWANIITGITAALAQVEIPKEVWAQYPLILIGVILVGWLARYYVANERDWREFVVKQVADKASENLRILQLVQTNNEQQLKIISDNHKEQIEIIQRTNEDRRKEQIALIEKNHQEQLKLQHEGLRSTFEAEIDRVLDLLVKAGHYDNKDAIRNRTEGDSGR